MEGGNRTNHAWIIEKPGKDHLVFRESPVPVPKHNEALLRIHFAGIGFTDGIAIDGNYFNAPSMPFVPGYEYIAEVVSFGPNTEAVVPVGQRVAVLSVVGGWQEYITAQIDTLVPLPEGTDPVKSIALILNYVTAYQLIHREALMHKHAHDQPERQRVVLFTGASGGVGLAFLELVRLLPKPWKVYGTTSPSKSDSISSRGAIPVDYSPGVDAVFEKLRKDEPEGFDFVFDGLGGPWASHGRGICKGSGKLICFGVTANTSAWAGFKSFMYPKVMNIFPGVSSTFYGITLLYKKDKSLFKEDLGKLFAFLKSGQINPQIDSVVQLAQAKEGLEKLLGGKVSGKIVIEVVKQ